MGSGQPTSLLPNGAQQQVIRWLPASFKQPLHPRA
jgi:hypothetical protein